MVHHSIREGNETYQSRGFYTKRVKNGLVKVLSRDKWERGFLEGIFRVQPETIETRSETVPYILQYKFQDPV